MALQKTVSHVTFYFCIAGGGRRVNVFALSSCISIRSYWAGTRLIVVLFFIVGGFFGVFLLLLFWWFFLTYEQFV